MPNSTRLGMYDMTNDSAKLRVRSFNFEMHHLYVFAPEQQLMVKNKKIKK